MPHSAIPQGDREMLEWTGAGEGARLKMLVHHDDGEREYAYGPAGDLPDTKVGTFSQSLMNEATSRGWTVISMKQDWKRVFAFEQAEYAHCGAQRELRKSAPQGDR
jgi:hypothetical protein